MARLTDGLEPAFPVEGPNECFAGLTKREWFAGQVLASVLSDGDTVPKVAAALAVEASNLLIRELNK